MLSLVLTLSLSNFFLFQGLCSSLIYHLGKTGAHSEAFSVYNMLRYSKRTISKALHENILHILIAGRLLKDAYVVVKVLRTFIFLQFPSVFCCFL